MSRSYRTIVAAAAFFPVLTLAAPCSAEAKGKTHAVVGTLQAVDGQGIVVQTKKGTERLTLVSSSVIRQGAATVPGGALGSYVGRRIKVRYVEVGDRKQVETVALAASSRPSTSSAVRPVTRLAGR